MLYGLTVCDRLMVVGSMVFITLNFAARGVLSLIETLGTPLFQRLTIKQIFIPFSILTCLVNRVWGDDGNKDGSLAETGHFYLILGVVGLFVYLSVGWIRKLIRYF